MTRLEQLTAQLAEACTGREDHKFALQALARPNGGTALSWKDWTTGEHGCLGTLDEPEFALVLPALFAWLRAWRLRYDPPPTLPTRAAKAVAPGTALARGAR
jgi:hypothetical protein